jgi:FG-GAP-like repeat/PASTA domain
MRRTGFGATVLLCTLVLSSTALGDRSWTGVAGLGNDAAWSAGLQVPRFSSPAWMNAGKNPFRMVAADLNGDDVADLAVVEVNSSAVSVRFGDGTGQFKPRFTYRTGRFPVGIAAGDLNGDGRLDLATASASTDKSVTVFINRGAGRFRRAGAYAAGREAYGVTAGDVNGDGIVDLLSAHASRQDFTVLLGRGGGAFQIAHRYRGGDAYDIAAADLNSDGKLDVVLADDSNSAVTVRPGGGDGTFGTPASYTSGSRPFGVAVADFNHDGLLDITAANYGGASVSVLLGAAGGSLGPRIRYPMGDEYDDYVDTVLVADYDRDGHLDIATPGAPYLRRGHGDGTLETRQRPGFAFTHAGAVADFNGDGWPDLAFSEACDEFELDCSRYPSRSIAVMLNWSGEPVPPCVVPPIVGATERDATRELEPAGCRLGHVRHSYSRRRPKGIVIRQRPQSASVRLNNSPVNLVVSRGRRH